MSSALIGLVIGCSAFVALISPVGPILALLGAMAIASVTALLTGIVLAVHTSPSSPETRGEAWQASQQDVLP
jgi:hypothetical protein